MSQSHLANRTTNEVHSGMLLLVPVGSTEQHGPHLPLGTDTLIAVRLAEELARRLGSARATQVLRDHKMVFDSAMRAEGYLLLADSTAAHIIGATASGVFYGAQTLKQLIHGNGAAATLHAATIRDWPAM